MLFLLARFYAAALAHGIINPDAIRWLVQVGLPAAGDGGSAMIEGRPIPSELAHLPDAPQLFMPGYDLASAGRVLPAIVPECLADAIAAGVDLDAIFDDGFNDTLAEMHREVGRFLQPDPPRVVDHFAERRAQARAEADAQADAEADDAPIAPAAREWVAEADAFPLVEALGDFEHDPDGARLILAAVAAEAGIEPGALGWDDLDHLDLSLIGGCTSMEAVHVAVDQLRRRTAVSL